MYWILVCVLGLSAIPNFVHVRLLYSSYNIRKKKKDMGFDEFKLCSAMFVFYLLFIY